MKRSEPEGPCLTESSLKQKGEPVNIGPRPGPWTARRDRAAVARQQKERQTTAQHAAGGEEVTGRGMREVGLDQWLPISARQW